MEHYDIVVVGAGVSGAAVAHRLASYDLSVALVEREADVSFGTSKANSGIIHGGFHHKRTYLKARLEIEGAAMYPRLHRELGFPYRQSGIVVAAFTQEEMYVVEHLYRQGVENASAGIELCGAQRMRDLEPQLHHDVLGGLHAPAGGIIEPYRFVFSLVENAELNGLTVIRDFEVTSGKRVNDCWEVISRDGAKIGANFVVNAAGLYADEVSRAFGAEDFTIHGRRGEYHLLDRSTKACPEQVIFPVPSSVSKGVLVIPTVEGTVLLGPTAEETDDKRDLDTRSDRLEYIVRTAQRLVPAVSDRDVITSFAGLRPVLESGDFYIAPSQTVPNLIQVAGIQSPGLTAAPAVGEYVKNILRDVGCRLTERSGYHVEIPRIVRTRTADTEAVREAWETSPDAGEVVCRCETVTRAEVVEAIRHGHTTVDGVKFFCRSGSGRCQGAFCMPRILEIIAEETGMPIDEVTKKGRGSEVVARPLDGTAAKRSRRGSPARRSVPSQVDTLVIGGGAAGMAAAAEIADAGYTPLIVDRERRLGGVLRQCVHNGFGIHEFREELTGPEYAERYEKEIREREVAALGETTVLALSRADGGFTAEMLSAATGPVSLEARSVMLAMGSRERNRGGIRIPGSRGAGVMTAGAAQRLVNVEGVIPGRKVVIIGSGDIGLIMARRMRLVGSEVVAVIEIQPVPSGINRNIVQCLHDFNIPLYLGHVVTSIHGNRRVTGVTVAPVERGATQPTKAFDLDCDTVLLSVGLIPENELSRELGVALHRQTGGPIVDSRQMTSIPGVFAAGNVLHIHDVVDFVAEESRRAGGATARYLAGEIEVSEVEVTAGANVRYVSPGRLSRTSKNRVYLRSLIVKNGASVEVTVDGEVWRRFRRPHVQPSEMVHIGLDGADIGADARKVEVSIR